MFTCYFARGFKKNKVNLRRLFDYLILALISAFAGCTSDPEPHQSDLEYMPLAAGVYQVYDVDSIWYTPSGPQEIQYELMTRVVDSFLNAEGRYTYVLYLYKRTAQEDPWQYMNTWSARQNDLRVVVGEGGTEFVKFVIPAAEGVKWNGNAYNSLGKDDYELVNTRQPSTVNAQTFPDCIEVVQNNDDDMIVRTDIRKEEYARGVGLILKEITVLNYCTVGCSGLGQIETGVVYTQRIKAYGID